MKINEKYAIELLKCLGFSLEEMNNGNSFIYLWNKELSESFEIENYTPEKMAEFINKLLTRQSRLSKYYMSQQITKHLELLTNK